MKILNYTYQVDLAIKKDKKLYQRTPMGNPYLSPNIVDIYGLYSPRFFLRTPAKYHGYTYVRGTPVLVPWHQELDAFFLYPCHRVLGSLGDWSQLLWLQRGGGGKRGGWDSMINGCFWFLLKDGTLANRLKSPVIMDPFSWLTVYTFCVWMDINS